MKLNKIEWDTFNKAHFKERGRCSQRQVEEIISSRCRLSRFVDLPRRENTEQRRIAYGETCGGHVLAVVFVMLPERVVRPIICYPFSSREQSKYFAWRNSVSRMRAKRPTRANPVVDYNLPEWPINKPIPNFRTFKQELDFYDTHSFANLLEARGKTLEKSVLKRVKRRVRSQTAKRR